MIIKDSSPADHGSVDRDLKVVPSNPLQAVRSDPLDSGSTSSAHPPSPGLLPFQDHPQADPQPGPLVDLAEDGHIPGVDLAGLGPPPEFTPYEANFFENDVGDVISHDTHLNMDGEALYRFLLSQAEKTPSYRLHCRGTHNEHRTRWVRETRSDGRTESRRETYTETVTDFDFYIDASPTLSGKPVHWSVPDSQPAFRGLMVRETESLGNRRSATRAEENTFDRWAKERSARGLAPWITSLDGWSDGLPDDPNPLKSSKTLRQWADDYCASPKYLKEFVYHKVPYGWNLQQLEGAVRASIHATMYSGTLEVEFTTHRSKIYIRPDNGLSRILSNMWLKFLSIILLIFPFIWLFKRFHARGGGRWEVCGGGYPLKRWVPIEESEEALPQYPESTQTFVTQGELSRIRQLPNGRTRLVGLSEGEWFRGWERSITRAVLGHYQSSIPLFDTGSNNAYTPFF